MAWIAVPVTPFALDWQSLGLYVTQRVSYGLAFHYSWLLACGVAGGWSRTQSPLSFISLRRTEYGYLVNDALLLGDHEDLMRWIGYVGLKVLGACVSTRSR
ncbi:uncharacterized protein BO80DRAFT_115665 [Aspergillus ibericus CBS 121593]|uniref:Uncharacterized protein n=1 Tax=Aspergillus ibericus CBS 121593 TaxID=1448316 RepID=A0A395GWH6_9EURO|nr:hypothetical protein BO80DRAFT_115665 [Aspergillus ibericus CBS 121593]RAK99782.1 hypothetical protein BO80DRAFT_115665 [Aspergillus ibericus CBS 121593]